MRQIKIFRLFWKNRNAPHKRKEEEALTSSSLYYAEDEGFKPPIPGKGILDFESSAFGHSANLPFQHTKS